MINYSRFDEIIMEKASKLVVDRLADQLKAITKYTNSLESKIKTHSGTFSTVNDKMDGINQNLDKLHENITTDIKNIVRKSTDQIMVEFRSKEDQGKTDKREILLLQQHKADKSEVHNLLDLKSS